MGKKKRNPIPAIVGIAIIVLIFVGFVFLRQGFNVADAIPRGVIEVTVEEAQQDVIDRTEFFDQNLVIINADATSGDVSIQTDTEYLVYSIDGDKSKEIARKLYDDGADPVFLVIDYNGEFE